MPTNPKLKKVLSLAQSGKKTRRTNRVRMGNTGIDPRVIQSSHKTLARMAVEISLKNPRMSLQAIVKDLGVHGSAIPVVVDFAKRLRIAYETELMRLETEKED